MQKMSGRLHKRFRDCRKNAFSNIKSLLYSRYYTEACNEWRDPSPRLSAWTTRLQKTSQRWRAVGDTVSKPVIEPLTSRTSRIVLTVNLTGRFVCKWNCNTISGVNARIVVGLRGLSPEDHVAANNVSSVAQLCYNEKAIKAATLASLLMSCRSSIYHFKIEEYRYVPFPTAQQLNLPVCCSHRPFNAERQAGKLWISILKSLGWLDSESNPSLQLQRWTLFPSSHILSCRYGAWFLPQD